MNCEHASIVVCWRTSFPSASTSLSPILIFPHSAAGPPLEKAVTIMESDIFIPMPAIFGVGAGGGIFFDGNGGGSFFGGYSLLGGGARVGFLKGSRFVGGASGGRKGWGWGGGNVCGRLGRRGCLLGFVGTIGFLRVEMSGPSFADRKNDECFSQKALTSLACGFVMAICRTRGRVTRWLVSIISSLVLSDLALRSASVSASFWWIESPSGYSIRESMTYVTR